MPDWKYRLTARAQIDGAVREPGYEFTLSEGERGPHRTVQKLRVVGTNSMQVPVDEPLFVPVDPNAPFPSEDGNTSPQPNGLVLAPASGLDTLGNLLEVISQPDATKQRLAELKEATAAHDAAATAAKAAADELAKKKTEHEAREAAIANRDRETLGFHAIAKERADAADARLRAAHEKTASADNLISEQWKAHRSAIAESERAVADREKAAVAAKAKAEALHRDVEKRDRLLKQAEADLAVRQSKHESIAAQLDRLRSAL